MPILPRKLELKLLKKEKIAEGTYSFYFERPPDFDFYPGQFLKLILDIPEPDERGNSRFFSIASSPSEKEYLMLTIRIDRSSFKKELSTLSPGTEVKIDAPFGAFVLNPQESTPHIFLAGGIGITPFRSMILYASDMNLSIPITLFASFRRTEDIIFQKKLTDIQKKHSWFKLFLTLTQPELSNKHRSENVGRISEELIKKNDHNYLSAKYFIAGPPNMVDDIIKIVKNLGVEETKIHREKFTGY